MLHNNWIEIWHQPKIDLKRKCLASAEALASICHPQHGVLLPGSFLPKVDESSVAELVQYALVATLSDPGAWPNGSSNYLNAGSRNGGGVSSGTGMQNTLSTMETKA